MRKFDKLISFNSKHSKNVKLKSSTFLEVKFDNIIFSKDLQQNKLLYSFKFINLLDCLCLI